MAPSSGKAGNSIRTKYYKKHCSKEIHYNEALSVSFHYTMVEIATVCNSKSLRCIFCYGLLLSDCWF